MAVKRPMDWVWFLCLSCAGAMIGCDGSTRYDPDISKVLPIQPVGSGTVEVSNSLAFQDLVRATLTSEHLTTVRILDPVYLAQSGTQDLNRSVDNAVRSTEVRHSQDELEKGLKPSKLTHEFNEKGGVLRHPEWIRVCRTYAY